MNSMPNPTQTDPHDVALAALKQAYEQFEDRQLPPVDERLSKIEQDAAHQQKRLAVPGRRGLIIGLLLAACIGAVAIAWQSNGDAAKQMIARWAPQLDLNSSPGPEKPVPAQPSPPALQT